MPPKTILFDFMGTCLDWHSTVVSMLPQSIPPSLRSSFALTWRRTYFESNTHRISQSLPVEDIDTTHAHTYDTVSNLPDFLPIKPQLQDPGVKEACVQAWHSQPAWPDVLPALTRLRAAGYEIIVHANGSTRLQLDLCACSGLRFDLLLSSQMLGVYKPAIESYAMAMELLRRRSEECVMVAAHAYDLRGAREAGMKTVYVYRWTDDVEEDQEVVKGECDVWVESMEGLVDVINGL